MKRIPLTQGQVAFVDDADFEWLSRWKWYAIRAKRTFYAVRNLVPAMPGGNQTPLRMHRAITRALEGIEVDHEDGNGLNNVRKNLRQATKQQNQFNRRKPEGTSSSKFYGVCWHKQHRKWRANINLSGRYKHLGYFEAEIEAARAYDAAANARSDVFCHLNFPNERTNL